MLGQDVSESVMTEDLAPSAGKEGISGTTAEFAHPSTQGCYSVFAQRGAAFPAPFAQATNMGTTAQTHVLATETDQLRGAQACLCRHEQECPIAAPHPSGLIGSRQESLYLASD